MGISANFNFNTTVVSYRNYQEQACAYRPYHSMLSDNDPTEPYAYEIFTSSATVKHVTIELESKTSIDLTFIGKIGIRVGIELKLTISPTGMGDVLSVGFSIEAGIYDELTGIMRYTYDKETRYGMTTKDGSHFSGVISNEIGIYAGLSFEWKFMIWEGEVAIAEFKFPIIVFGNAETPISFSNTDESYSFTSRTLNLAQKQSDGRQLLSMNYLYLGSTATTAPMVNVRFPQFNGNLACEIVNINPLDAPFVKVDKNGMITISENTAQTSTEVTETLPAGVLDSATPTPKVTINRDRIDFTVSVTYTGAFTFGSNKPMSKLLHLSWKKDASVTDKEWNVNFYGYDNKLISSTKALDGALPTEPPFSDIVATLPEDPILRKYGLQLGNGSTYWQNFGPVRADTDFHLIVKPTPIIAYYHIPILTDSGLKTGESKKLL